MTQRDLVRDAKSGQNIRVIPFAKDKGGVGSTGTLAAVHYHLLQKGEKPILIEASTEQEDILKPYQARHTVVEIDLNSENGVSTLLDQLEKTEAGTSVLINIPGRSLVAIEKLHDRIAHFNALSPIKAETTTVWTMGLDWASRAGLNAMLAGNFPGKVLLNLPEWAGLPKDFDNVDDELEEKIIATGGSLFCCPRLSSQLLHLFRGPKSLGLDEIEELPDLRMGARAEFRAWQHRIQETFSQAF